MKQNKYILLVAAVAVVVSVCLSFVITLSVVSCSQSSPDGHPVYDHPVNNPSASDSSASDAPAIESPEDAQDTDEAEESADIELTFEEECEILAKKLSEEWYRDAYHVYSDDEPLLDYLDYSYTDDGRAVIVANVPESVGMSHNGFIILSSKDYGITWSISPESDWYWGFISQILINGDDVYLVENSPVGHHSSIWHSADFCATFEDSYFVESLAAEYAEIMEECSFSLRILNVDYESGDLILCWNIDEFHRSWDSDFILQNCWLITRVDRNLKNPSVLYADNKRLEDEYSCLINYPN